MPDGGALIGCFLLDVSCKPLMRSCHFGLLADRCRRSGPAQILEGMTDHAETVDESTARQEASAATVDGCPCPKCSKDQQRVIACVVPQRRDGG